MKQLCLAILFAFCSTALTAAGADKPTVTVMIAKDQDSKPSDTLPADVPKVYAFFKTTGTHAGDKLRGVFIADDVGDAAPKGTKIDEATLTADKDNFHGAFSLSKPTNGWPAGKYHVDIYAGDDLVTSARFTIKAAAEEKDGEEED